MDAKNVQAQGHLAPYLHVATIPSPLVQRGNTVFSAPQWSHTTAPICARLSQNSAGHNTMPSPTMLTRKISVRTTRTPVA